MKREDAAQPLQDRQTPNPNDQSTTKNWYGTIAVLLALCSRLSI